MREQDQLSALPLLLARRDLLVLDLVAPKEFHAVHDEPGQRAAKVDQLVQHKGQEPRGQDVVLHVRVPGRPGPLEDVEMHVVLGDFFELAPVRVRLGKVEEGGGVPG